MGDARLLWRARHVELNLRRPLVMGILNVTPDSFSDGGLHFGDAPAVAHGLRLVEEGADILDIGGESTRPGAQPVAVEEEWKRIGRVITEIGRKSDTPISVDTYKPEVARKAIRAGAVIVNDVRGLRDSEMARVVANSDAGTVIMHMQGEPATMQKHPTYTDVVAEVRTFLALQMEEAIRQKVAPEAIVLDPGFGFGKTPAHNLELLRGLGSLQDLGRPILVGVSRKSFPQGTQDRGDARRPEVALATAAIAILRGANIVRVHDVAETVRYVRMLDGLLHGS